MRGKPFAARLWSGLLRPTHSLLGADIAGQVESVGRDVVQFKPGDEVFGDISGYARGSFAEYASAPADLLALKPNNVSFEEAAAVPLAAVVALQAIRYAGQIRPGDKVLVQGASGGVGTFAVQLAKAFGAEVTGVCSTRNLEMVRSIGADHVVDYTREDFTQKGQLYDMIVAVNGYRSIAAYRRALSSKGTYVCAGGSMSQVIQSALLGPLMSGNGRKMGNMGIGEASQEDLVFLAKLLEAGKIVPVIDKCYPLSEVAEAFRYYEQVHPQGKVVITVV
jgi:NADPH:quinone reductase-like Zn-dependent oxidoreductase